ncbi:hypothetical protein GYH30_041346 [Glycine max]|nr:hypothetical protein GYH30_041346 [Glycine max]
MPKQDSCDSAYLSMMKLTFLLFVFVNSDIAWDKT